jgi:hypothetical protein
VIEMNSTAISSRLVLKSSTWRFGREPSPPRTRPLPAAGSGSPAHLLPPRLLRGAVAPGVRLVPVRRRRAAKTGFAVKPPPALFPPLQAPA